MISITVNSVFTRYQFTPKHHARCKKKIWPKLYSGYTFKLGSPVLTRHTDDKLKIKILCGKTDTYSIISHQLCTLFTPTETYNLPLTAYNLCTIFFL